MSEKNMGQNGVQAGSGDIMQHIQDMIGDLLKNSVEKMHKSDTGNILGDTTAVGDKSEIPAEMDLADIKNFIDVMQKFIDNVKVMVLQLETGSSEPGSTDDKFIDGYMATADNILEMAAFSMKDSLTGLSNRYGFDNRLILEWNRATRDKTALGLVIFAVDNSDKNKQEEVLKAVSETLEKTIKRSTDFIARWSENEFAVLLPITEEVGVSIVAERIRVEIGKITIPGIEKVDGKTPVSIGVCVEVPEPTEQPANMINKAFDAYKKAKTEATAIVFA